MTQEISLSAPTRDCVGGVSESGNRPSRPESAPQRRSGCRRNSSRSFRDGSTAPTPDRPVPDRKQSGSGPGVDPESPVGIIPTRYSTEHTLPPPAAAVHSSLCLSRRGQQIGAQPVSRSPAPSVVGVTGTRRLSTSSSSSENTEDPILLRLNPKTRAAVLPPAPGYAADGGCKSACGLAAGAPAGLKPEGNFPR
ncbi:hypothetical protein AOLI_G00054710 [Acnodon oligacanthus]